MKSSRAMRKRELPSASRTLSSRRRASARASSKLAILAHATSSTSPTAMTIAKSGVSNRVRSEDLPVAAAASVSGSRARAQVAPSTICGCAARRAAFVCSRPRPGFRRTIICSHAESRLANRLSWR
jgi:hypothetical protein